MLFDYMYTKSMRIIGVAVLIFSFIILVGPTKTYAHQSGCHRWHSCPSDSGSYVCGDTGHSNYCGTSPAPTYTPPAQSTPTYTPPTSTTTPKTTTTYTQPQVKSYSTSTSYKPATQTNLEDNNSTNWWWIVVPGGIAWWAYEAAKQK